MDQSDEWEQDVIGAARQALGGSKALDPKLRAAYDQLFARHYRRVYSVCLYWTRSEQRAAELAQETMLTGHRKLADYRGDARFGTWLCGIAKMKALNARRKRQDMLSEDGELEVEGGEKGALAAMASEERAVMVRACISRLDPDDADFAHARWLDQLEVREIEEIFALGKGEGRVIQQRCKRKLAKLFAEWLEAHGHGLSFVQGTTSGGGR